MRKFFLAVAALAMLATSCTKDETAPMGNESLVSFSIDSPELTTRADGDGEHITHLQYAFYNEDGILAEISKIGDDAIEFTGKTTIQVYLVEGRTYQAIFWADNAAAPYDVTFDEDNVSESTMTIRSTAWTANSDIYDAFYKFEDDIRPEEKTHTITLTRPFAQINIATADTEKAKKAGVVVEASKMVAFQAYTTLNLVDGVASNKTEFTYSWAAIPTTPAKVTVNGQSFDMLAMNYVLANGRELMEKVTLGVSEEEVSATATYADAITREYTTVPVQRNYRTYIVGNLLTTPNDFEVETKPGFDGEEEAYYIQDGNAVVATAAGLDQLAADFAAGKVDRDIDIVLDGDIDLAALATRAATSNWTPIGTEEAPFKGTFDGKGYSIKNLNIVETEAKEGKAFIGFFGYAKDATVKNVTFENVYLNIACLDIDHSQGHIGAVAGSLEGTSVIENVTVKGDVKVEATVTANGASRVAVVAGGNSYGNVTMKNVHVTANEGSYLKANNNVGALAGQLQGKNVFENCSSNIDVTGTKFFAGGLIGIAAGDSQFTNCHTTGNVTVTAGREGRANDHYRVGGIAGGWADGATKVCTLTDCSYTGALSGTNADGSVAEAFDYAGYVGRGYTLNGCAGSKVIVNGTSYTQKGNAAPFGIYEVNKAVSTAEELTEALKADKDYVGINLAADINTEDSFKVVKDIVLDLAGHTISGTDKLTTSYALIEVQPDVNFEITNTAAENGKLTVVATNERNWNAFSSVVSNQRGTLTVGKGVVIEHLGGTAMAYGIDNLTNTGNQKAIATINGATVKSPYRAIRQFLNSTKEGVNNELYVNSGVIEGTNKSIWMQNANAGANPGKLVVEATAQLKGDVFVSGSGATTFPVEVSVASAALVGESTVLASNLFVKYEVVEVDGTWIVNEKEGAVVSNATALAAALDNDEVSTIFLAKGNFGTIVAKSNKTIIGCPDAKVDCVNLNGADNVTLQNITFDAATAKMACNKNGAATQPANIVTGIHGGINPTKGARNLTIEGCTFAGTFVDGGVAIAFTDQGRTQSGDITIKGCTFDTKEGYADIYVYYGGYGYMNIENNTFKTSYPPYGPTITLRLYQSSTPVVVKGNTFENQVSLESAMYLTAHSSGYTVSVDASNNTFAN